MLRSQLGGFRVKGLSHEMKAFKKHLSQSDSCGCIWLTSLEEIHVVITVWVTNTV
jgi:hypothetical protein